jgi:hypothetical protein
MVLFREVRGFIFEIRRDNILINAFIVPNLVMLLNFVVSLTCTVEYTMSFYRRVNRVISSPHFVNRLQAVALKILQ